MPGKYQHLFEIMHVYGQIEEAEDALSIKELKVNGKDIMSLGVQGKKVGEIAEAQVPSGILRLRIESITL